MSKKIISLLLAFVMIFSMLSVMASAKSVTVATAQDAMKLCVKKELYTFKKGTLYTDGKSKGTVYVISLIGSSRKWDKNDIRGIQVCIKSGFGKDNMYLDAVVAAAKKDIPKDAKVVLVGHSLGGMIAQQFAANEEMKQRFQIINTLTLGSPYIVTKDREGDLHRMVDSADYIPYLSSAMADNWSAGNYTKEDNGYKGNAKAAHYDSYLTGKAWLKYDCFGIKNGTNKIVFK
ncbi:MAG: alpha/beta hydrolase [Clostridia bacterium]|nr:alpha/beta hydrolase [Clostridia bacterium]